MLFITVQKKRLRCDSFIHSMEEFRSEGLGPRLKPCLSCCVLFYLHEALFQPFMNYWCLVSSSPSVPGGLREGRCSLIHRPFSFSRTCLVNLSAAFIIQTSCSWGGKCGCGFEKGAQLSDLASVNLSAQFYYGIYILTIISERPKY